MPRPRLSRLILEATGLIVALVLLGWLAVWINPTRRGISGRWVAQRGLTRPWIAHQAADVEKVAAASRGSVPESDYDALRDVLRAHLARAGHRPVVLYLSAAGVVNDQGAVLLRGDAPLAATSSDSSSPAGSLTLEDLLAVLDEAAQRFAGQSQFLIWDAGQVGSDRNLGVYGNAFLKRLRTRLAEKPPRRLAILLSCAPGQTSWASERDGRSVFGYFVERLLATGRDGQRGPTVRSFSQQVRAHVALWVRNHRQAEQTPELLGDPSVDFPLPRLRPVRAEAGTEPAAPAEGARLLKRLERAWTEHETWRARRPYRTVPRTWLRYQETLLRAERQFRAGEYAEAELTLNSLPNLANELKRVPPLQGSLAMLERRQAETQDRAPRTELASARTNLEEALDAILGEEATNGSDSGGGPEPKAPEKPVEGAGPSPSAKGAEPSGSSAEKSARAPAKKTEEPAPAAETPDPQPKRSSSLSRRSLSLRRKTDSPLGRLVAEDDDQRPLYPEAQLLVWANTFVSRGPDRNAFHGRRGDGLTEALKTRLLAEEAAASDERINRWIRPWVDAGDQARRKAQDLLFDSESALPDVTEALEQAVEHYQDARKNAETCERAVDLLEQLAAELPYYGEWKSRRPGGPEPGIDPPLAELLDAAAELARRLQQPPSDARTPVEDSLADRDAQIQQIKAAADRAATAWRGLTDDFRNQWEGGRWRDLDAALCVPLIPADVRMRMLERARSAPVASTLSGSLGLTAGGPPAARSDDESAAGSGTLAGVRLPRLADRAEDSATLEPGSTDPGFWKLASGLARLEVALLEIGGARKDETAPLRDALERAERRLARAPFDDFADISERIRNLRSLRVASSSERAGADRAVEDLRVHDMALRVLPLADAPNGDKAAEDAVRALRRDVLTWQGERLLEDFDPRHALAVLARARDDFGASSTLEAAAEKARIMARARLAVETVAPEKPTIDDAPEWPLGIRIRTDGPVPAGEAVAFVAYDAQTPVSVKRKGGQAGRSATSLVAVGPAGVPKEAEFVVERADSTPERVTVRLEPGAFYRGQIYPKDLEESALGLTLNPSKEGIDVTLRQSDRKLVKLFGDQFERHPGQGFLHPHTPLAYKFVINHTYTRPTRVWVRYGLEGKDETQVVRPDIRLEVGRPNEEIKDRVDTDLHEISTNQPRYLVLEIRRENESGRVLFHRRYPFRQVSPSEYMRVQDGFDELSNMAYVNVWHLKSDPVSGPSELTVMLGGQSLSTTLDRGQAEQWWRIYPQPPPPVLWRIQVEKVLDAFKGKIETGVALPQPPKPPAQ